MKFELKSHHRNIENEALIEELKRIYELLKSEKKKMSIRNYDKYGKYTSSTIALRFGTWNNALIAADIQPSEEKNVDIGALFENLSAVWIFKQEQPVSRDMGTFPSKYTALIYADRFGSWRKALEAFVESEYNCDGELDIGKKIERSAKTIENSGMTKSTKRHIAQRMRFYILQRDNFKCQACGRSPATDAGVVLHIDHIIPWSKGGETTINNLTTRCRECNLGKGNSFEK